MKADQPEGTSWVLAQNRRIQPALPGRLRSARSQFIEQANVSFGEENAPAIRYETLESNIAQGRISDPEWTLPEDFTDVLADSCRQRGIIMQLSARLFALDGSLPKKERPTAPKLALMLTTLKCLVDELDHALRTDD